MPSRAPSVTIWGTGTPRKLMDSRRLHDLGWKAKVGLEEGLRNTYENFLTGART